MKVNRKWLLLVALVLSVAMATTGTLAYLTDEDADVNTMVLGKVEIVQNEQERREDGKLDEFTQDKPLYPAVYEGTSIEWADESKWPNPNEAWKVVENNSNVVDKFVTVTNTGKSPAYVRTIIAYESDAINGTNIHIVHNANSSSNPAVAGEFAATDYIENVEINGVRYDVIVYTYANPLAPGETTIPSLKQIYMDKTCDNEQMEEIDENKNGKYDILVLSQAVQSNGFEEYGAVDALNEAFNEGKELTAAKVAEWFGGDLEVGSPGDKNGTNNPPTPFAKVTTLDADEKLELTKDDGTKVTIVDEELTINTDGSLNWGLELGWIPLDVAYQFEPAMTLAEAQESDYRYWHADFVVSVNKEVPAYSIGLAGYYDAWCQYNEDAWVLLASPEAIPAGKEIRLVESLGDGISVNYEELCQFGNDGIGFLCGAAALKGEKTADGNEITAEVPAGTVLTVELRLYETEEPSEQNGNSHNVETGKYITTGVYTYTFN